MIKMFGLFIAQLSDNILQFNKSDKISNQVYDNKSRHSTCKSIAYVDVCD